MSDSDLALVRARRKVIAAEMAELAMEDDDLEVTERTLARLQAAKPKSNGNGAHPAQPPTPEIKPQAEMKQPDYVIGTLKSTPDPWVASAAELQELIRKTHGLDIKTNSFHPILSHLKKDGVIMRDGQRIALTERVKGH